MGTEVSIAVPDTGEDLAFYRDTATSRDHQRVIPQVVVGGEPVDIDTTNRLPVVAADPVTGTEQSAQGITLEALETLLTNTIARYAEQQLQTTALGDILAALAGIETGTDIITTVETNQDAQTALLTTMESNQDTQTGHLSALEDAITDPGGLPVVVSGETTFTDMTAATFNTPVSISAVASSTTLIAANSARRGWTIQNLSSADLYVRVDGGTAAIGSCHRVLAQGQHMGQKFMDGDMSLTAITGRWASAAGGTAIGGDWE